MKGKLTLVPTPISDNLPLEIIAWEKLNYALTKGVKKSIIVVEELKVARIRFSSWGLPLGSLDKFIALNEQTSKEVTNVLLKDLKIGKDIFLLSDSGLPAVCDPGRELISLCHKNKIKVTSTPFCSAPSLAIALSGFDCSKYYFAGFVSAKSQIRKQQLTNIFKRKEVIVLMETPYRLKPLLSDISKILPLNTKILLAFDLNGEHELAICDQLKTILKLSESLIKAPFVLVVDLN